MYFSHHRIIKCVCFKSIHCTINLDVTSSSRACSDLIICFYRIYC